MRTKRHNVLTYGQGIPLCAIVTAANMHDMKAAIHTLDNVVIKRPSSNMYKEKQNLSLSRYEFQEIENDVVIKKGYLPYIRH